MKLYRMAREPNENASHLLIPKIFGGEAIYIDEFEITEGELIDLIAAWDIQTAIDGNVAYSMLAQAILSKLS